MQCIEYYSESDKQRGCMDAGWLVVCVSVVYLRDRVADRGMWAAATTQHHERSSYHL